nr:metallophosphoesterase [Peptoniphilus sp.]
MHTADLHLGRSFPYVRDADRETGRKDRFLTFRRILSLGKRREIDYLFLVGDIFEQDMIRREEVDYVLSTLGEMPFVTLLLLGNHDYKLYEYVENRLNDRVQLFSRDELTTFYDDERKVAFHGISWNRESYHRILQYEGADMSDGYRHVLLHHGNWTGGDGYFPVDANILPYFDYIALGHVHKPILYENKLQMCGTPEPLDHTDRGRLGVVFGELGETLSTEYIPLARRSLRHKTLHIDDGRSEDVLASIRETLDDASSIYSFYVTGTYSGILDAEMRRFLDAQDVLYRLEWAQDLPKMIEKVERAHADDALGAFIRRARSYDVDEETRLKICDLGIRALLGEDYDS